MLCLICYGNLYCRCVTSHVLYELFLKDLFTCVLQVELIKVSTSDVLDFACNNYNASIALVAPTGGGIGTIHVQVQLVVRWRRHRSQSLSVFVKGLDNRYCYIPRRQDLLDARG